NTMSALADADNQLGHVDRAIGLEIGALRLKYLMREPESIAVSHFNLANYLARGNRDAELVWAHRLASALIRMRIGSPRLTPSVQAVGRLGPTGTQAKPPVPHQQGRPVVQA